ncbi:MAG: winged helix-turn-helix transcriptional regulator [Planctomycetes bacterium]|nr:winged helix-turn-helix transcriptional regulator [Planctomycetota bacterium]
MTNPFMAARPSGSEDRAMREFLAITKALSDESRVRALMALAGGELCVCQIIELLGLAPSTVSKHMAILHQARLVETRKDGRWTYYRMAEEACLPCVPQALAMARECLATDDRIRQDARMLKGVRKMTREDLCRHFRNCQVKA